MVIEIKPIDVEIDGRQMKDAEITVDETVVTADDLIALVYGNEPNLEQAYGTAQAVLSVSWDTAPAAVKEELRSQAKQAADELTKLTDMLAVVNERVAVIQRLSAPYGGSVMLTSLAIGGSTQSMAGYLEQSPKRVGLIYRALRSALKKLREGIIGEMSVDTIDAINAGHDNKQAR